MTTLALTQFINRTPAALQRIGDAITAFLEGVDEARTLSRRFENLSRLSDTELSRRGLKRADIAEAVLKSGRA
jgi:hypothetical protein